MGFYVGVLAYRNKDVTPTIVVSSSLHKCLSSFIDEMHEFCAAAWINQESLDDYLSSPGIPEEDAPSDYVITEEDLTILEPYAQFSRSPHKGYQLFRLRRLAPDLTDDNLIQIATLIRSMVLVDNDFTLYQYKKEDEAFVFSGHKQVVVQ